MRVPDESLEDFVSPAPKPAEPPSVKLVLPSGTVEVLKPLAGSMEIARREAGASKFIPPSLFPGRRQEASWFLRSLAVGGGVLVIGAFIVLSSIFIAIYDPPVEPVDTQRAGASNRQYEKPVRPPKAPGPFASMPGENPAQDRIEAFPNHATPGTARRVPARSRAVLAAYRPRRRSHRPQMVVTNFVPTTLVIYPENGVIKTRIQPQLTAGYKKEPTLPN